MNKLKALFTLDLNSSHYKRYFFENLAGMLASGIDILSILSSFEKESNSKTVKKIVAEMRNDVENGYPLSKVLSNQNFLSPNAISLIQVGEKSGNLAENLNAIVTQMQKESELRNKLRSASLYPAFIGAILLGVIVIMLGFVLPRLSQVYSSLKAELPLITKIMISIGDFFGKYGGVAIPLFLVITFIIIYFIFINKNTKHLGQSILMSIPGIKRLILEVEMSRMGYIIYSLLRNGIPVNTSFSLLADSSNINIYKNIYKFISTYIEQGYTLKEIFENKVIKKLIPLYGRELILSGEKSGKMPESFKKLYEVFEKKNELTTKDIGVLFEPILLLLVWVGITFLALSVILPLYNIVGNFNNLSSPSNTTQKKIVPTVPTSYSLSE